MRLKSSVIYRGPSQIDGSPIVAIGVIPRQDRVNAKTGDMLAVYILSGVYSPMEALRNGADFGVCGNCPHRPQDGDLSRRTCYVVVAQGPQSVWARYGRGNYAVCHTDEDRAQLGEDRAVRMGAYGDPAAVPAYVWLSLLRRARMRTGYTHQWREYFAQYLRPLVMASCDSPAEREDARAMGWRTFTVRLPSDPLAVRESTCPASTEAGHKTQCVSCGACNGAGLAHETPRRGSIAIVVHGGGGQLAKYGELRATGAL